MAFVESPLLSREHFNDALVFHQLDPPSKLSLGIDAAPLDNHPGSQGSGGVQVSILCQLSSVWRQPHLPRVLLLFALLPSLKATFCPVIRSPRKRWAEKPKPSWRSTQKAVLLSPASAQVTRQTMTSRKFLNLFVAPSGISSLHPCIPIRFLLQSRKASPASSHLYVPPQRGHGVKADSIAELPRFAF